MTGKRERERSETHREAIGHLLYGTQEEKVSRSTEESLDMNAVNIAS